MNDPIVNKLFSMKRNPLFESISLNEVDDEDMEEDIPEEDPDNGEEEEGNDSSVSDNNREEADTSTKNIGVPNNPNPLDNLHAINYKIGDKVSISYTNGTPSNITGIVQGYDKEGFYRIVWEDGSTTNGITDYALLLSDNQELDNKCVCGSQDFVTEGTHLVCDKCGRRIRENLIKTDNKKSKIYSKATPVNTSINSSLRDPIKKGMKRAIDEDYDEEDYEDDYEEEETEDDIFSDLRNKLSGEFWSRLPELKEDIEELGYTVDDINNEYVVVSIESDDKDYYMQVPIEGTSRTMYLNFDRARMD